METMTMTVADLAALPAVETLTVPETTALIVSAYTSDLLSDVMAHAEEGSVLITIQGHKNSVAVATLVGIRAILVCNAREIPDDMLAAATREGVAVLRTARNQFEASVLVAGALQG